MLKEEMFINSKFMEYRTVEVSYFRVMWKVSLHKCNAFTVKQTNVFEFEQT